MVSSLVRLIGVRHLALAEDAVQDALLRALETWKFGHAPRIPSAWLRRSARNRAIDLLPGAANGQRLAPAVALELDYHRRDARFRGRACHRRR